MRHQLTVEQVEFYKDHGYLIGLPPIYTGQEIAEMRAELPGLIKLLQKDETPKDIREWHETSRFLYDICMNPKLHDEVEGILAPSFYIWASSFFIKEPHTKETVGWHQDANYWPMRPFNTVTVWMAFTDVDEENGAMRIMPGSHRMGLLQNDRSTTVTDSVLTLELEDGIVDERQAISLNLKEGEISIHDDRAVLGSTANCSDRKRVGLTVCYSRTNVENDLTINPNFKTYLCRGIDECQIS